MQDRHRNRTLGRVATPVLAAASAVVLAACGGGSDRATSLLRQTFTGSHRITSGNLGMALTIIPSGAGTLKAPLTIRFGGPFQSLGAGRLPESNFTLSLGSTRAGVSLALLSTGTRGYVTYRGQSYQLPPASFRRLEASFAQVGSAPGSRTQAGALAKLGIQPGRWLVDPQVVGDEAIAGTNTILIHAGIDAPALLTDLNTFLRRAASAGAAGAGNLPGGISAATRRGTAAEIYEGVNIWTGAADKTLRRLQLRLNVDVRGRAAGLLGRRASLELTLEYADLNQPQTITPPATVLPYSKFQAKLRVLLAGLETGLVSGG